MHAKEKHLHRLYGKEEIARDGASIYCFIILEVWQSLVYCAGLENRRSVNAGPGVRIPQLPHFLKEVATQRNPCSPLNLFHVASQS